MIKKSIYLIVGIVTSLASQAQENTALFRFPDVSADKIVFTYANDLWVVPKVGGTASRLSSPAGIESYPKFSPDGKTIAFSANYDGNREIYTIPTEGGVSFRVTYHGMPDRMVDWNPDGQSLVFASPRSSEKERYNKFFKISKSGGLAEALPFAYAEFGSYSPDGKKMAMVFETQIGRTWKRYRGGNVANIHIFDFQTLASENITGNSEAGDEFPMWVGNKIYFISDRGTEKRMNIWSYDVTSKAFTQHTNFTDYDIHYPSLGNEDIIFEQAGKIMLFNIQSGNYKVVPITVLYDGISLKPHIENAASTLQYYTLSADGNRALIAARGDIFSLPAEKGYVKNLTQTTGVAERYPNWSPDGKTLAYWSDKSGEYELYFNENGKETKVTSLGPGFRYSLFWSPDSKKLAFIDKAMKIMIFDRSSFTVTEVDHMLRATHGSLEGFVASWSSDSRYLTYSRDLDNNHQSVFIYDYTTKKNTQVTSGYYNAYSPTFDPESKYLYVLTDRHFDPSYSSIDATFIYSNSTQVAAITLKNSTPSPLAPENDTMGIKSDATAADSKDDKKTKTDKDKKDAPKGTTIDFDGFESRMVILTESAGNYYALSASKGKVFYLHLTNTGSAENKASLNYFDLEKRKEKTVMDDVDGYTLSYNGEKIIVTKGGNYSIIKAEEGQKMEHMLAINDMKVMVDPMQEWNQIFMDAWRLERDYFYDPAMHGVDWNKVKTQYQAMLKGATNREEVNFVLGEMIGEMNASHTYRYGGDEEAENYLNVGYLGVEWQLANNFYQIKQIIKPADWDIEVRSPLDQPGSTIKEGYYILAVNGIALDPTKEPYAAFQGLGGKTVELTYNTSPTLVGAKTTIVKLLGSEMRLRHLAWIEKNRKTVEQATGGQCGYIYVESTGVQGQNELIRQFNAQFDKKSLIIDERFNNGGQIPDRFIEMLNRPPLVYWAIRDGKSWPWPQYANFGHKVMLINGWSGSGGDAFPDYFRKKGLGKLIGTRTWGGLIGISGVPSLIDGGEVTVPTFRMYNLDGTWFGEGHGVDPDILVPENLTDMAKGIDPQLERGIAEIKELLKNPFQEPAIPQPEKR